MCQQETKFCWKCKTEVSDFALRCINCNAFFPSTKMRKKFLSIILVALILFVVFDDAPSSPPPPKKPTFSPSTSGLILDNPELFKTESCYRIVGKIQNTGKDSWDFITVRATYYDKNKRLIDTNQTLISRTLKPGENTPFKITFGCCEKTCDMSLYDHYTTNIDSALFVKD